MAELKKYVQDQQEVKIRINEIGGFKYRLDKLQERMAENGFQSDALPRPRLLVEESLVQKPLAVIEELNEDIESEPAVQISSIQELPSEGTPQ